MLSGRETGDKEIREVLENIIGREGIWENCLNEVATSLSRKYLICLPLNAVELSK